MLKKINNCIYLLLLMFLFVDSFTGLSISIGGPSFSIPYKLFILFLMMIVILAYNTSNISAIIITFLFALLSISLFVVLQSGVLDLTYYLQKYFKFLANIIFYIYFLSLQKYDPYYYKKAIKIFKVNLYLFMLNILIGCLGFGNSTYSDGSGVCGFFYAGNELFLVYISFAIILLHLHTLKSLPVKLVIVLALAILIGTKSTILSALILEGYYINKFYMKKRKGLFLFLLPIIIVSVYILYVYMLSKLRTFDYVIYKLTNDKSDKNFELILDIIMSGRVTYIKDAFNIWVKDYSLVNLLFGTGSNIISTVEVDVFDVFLINGLILTVIIAIFYMVLLRRARKYYNKELSLMIYLFLFISLFAGHTWGNLSGGLFFILLNIYYDELINANYFPKLNQMKKKVFLYMRLYEKN